MTKDNAQAQDQTELDESQIDGEADNEESQEKDDSEETEDNKTDDKDSDDGEADDSEDDANSEDQEYVVAGKKFNNLTDALKAVNRISGDNTRLAGEVKALEEQVRDHEEKYKKAVEANKAWQSYFEGKGEMPKQNLKDIAREIFEEKHAEDSAKELKAQYSAEMEEVKAELAELAEEDEEGAKEIQDEMYTIGNKLGKDINKISPGELLKMAKGMLNKITPEAKNLIKDIEKRTVAKTAAKKIVGGAKNKASVHGQQEMSPELANYLKQVS